MGSRLRRVSSNPANISFVDCELKDDLKWCLLDHDSVWFLWTVCILLCRQQGMSHRNTQQPCSAGGVYMSLCNVGNILVSIPICICIELDINTYTYTNIHLHTRAFSETSWWWHSGVFKMLRGVGWTYFLFALFVSVRVLEVWGMLCVWGRC